MERYVVIGSKNFPGMSAVVDKYTNSIIKDNMTLSSATIYASALNR